MRQNAAFCGNGLNNVHLVGKFTKVVLTFRSKSFFRETGTHVFFPLLLLCKYL